MIFCISANPAIDRRLRLDRLRAGEVNRALTVEPFPGGKSAHVAMAARALGEEVMWVGFLGGPTGEAALRGLKALSIPVLAVRIEEETRTNLEIIDEAGTVTEILEPGPRVTPSEVEEMVSVCRSLFERCGAQDRVVISGSLPPGVSANLYAQLIHSAHDYNCRVLLDASGEALRCALEASPDFVKPNRQEAEQLTGLDLCEEQSLVEATGRLIEAGARSVAVSLGEDGMIWQSACGATPLRARPPRVKAVSTVGSGDAAMAGFAVAQVHGLNEVETIRLAVACGTANCMEGAPGIINARDVEALLPQVSVQAIESLVKD